MRLADDAISKPSGLLGALIFMGMLWAPLSIAGDLPSMTQFSDSKNTVTLSIPTDWDVAVDSVFRNAQVSDGDLTKMVVSWNDTEEKPSQEDLLNGTLQHLQESITGLTLTEIRQRPFASGNGRTAITSYEAYDTTLSIGAAVLYAPQEQRVFSAVLISPEEQFDDINGLQLLQTVLTSIKVITPNSEIVPTHDGP